MRRWIVQLEVSSSLAREPGYALPTSELANLLFSSSSLSFSLALALLHSITAQQLCAFSPYFTGPKTTSHGFVDSSSWIPSPISHLHPHPHRHPHLHLPARIHCDSSFCFFFTCTCTRAQLARDPFGPFASSLFVNFALNGALFFIPPLCMLRFFTSSLAPATSRSQNATCLRFNYSFPLPPLLSFPWQTCDFHVK